MRLNIADCRLCICCGDEQRRRVSRMPGCHWVARLAQFRLKAHPGAGCWGIMPTPFFIPIPSCCQLSGTSADVCHANIPAVWPPCPLVQVRNLMLQVQRVDLRNANTNSYVAATFTLPAANRQLPASCMWAGCRRCLWCPSAASVARC